MENEPGGAGPKRTRREERAASPAVCRERARRVRALPSSGADPARGAWNPSALPSALWPPVGAGLLKGWLCPGLEEEAHKMS